VEEYEGMGAFQRLEREAFLFSNYLELNAPHSINIEDATRRRAHSHRYHGKIEIFEVIPVPQASLSFKCLNIFDARCILFISPSNALF